MKTAGIRDVRQNLSALLEEIKRGREILITDRGRPVARLVPPMCPIASPFPNLAAFRKTMPTLKVTVSSAIAEDRDDRF
ncbi:MAG: type II toxin-antitoxin system prevent-host-death family antitoxin [Candidatus Baltobacteraceae bacterium]